MNVLRDLRESTQVLFLQEISMNRHTRLRTIAERLGMTVQGASDYARRLEADGLTARAIQHEIDHLDGILFLDRIGPLKRRRLVADYKKAHRDDTGYLKDIVPEGAAKAY